MDQSKEQKQIEKNTWDIAVVVKIQGMGIC